MIYSCHPVHTIEAKDFSDFEERAGIAGDVFPSQKLLQIRTGMLE